MNKYLILAYLLIFLNSFISSEDGCSSLSSGYCSSYTPTEADGDKRCIENSNQKCQLLECKDLERGYCSYYNLDSDETRCVPTADYEGCELKKCEDMNSKNCQAYGSYDGKYCYPVNNQCKLVTCEEMNPKECDLFRPNNLDPSSNCVNIGESCAIKKCTELTTPYCGNYIPDNSDEKCVAKSGGTECEIITCSGYDST